ncbi:MAG: DUF484 family protein [Gammaproteobacteria bacterium]|nr:DUF484 family protein [Gammaproteobacteria bacterium]
MTTTQGTAVSEPGGEMEKLVAQYLRAHPDFLSRHPDVLAALQIAHPTGRAVSLVERQVSVLRDQNRSLKTRFDDLLGIARENENLSRRLHALTLNLMQASSIADVVATLESGLQADFRADSVVVRVFRQGGPVAPALATFVGADAPERAAFADALRSRRPLCGRLKRVQHQALFGGDDGESGSAVVLPLGGRGWDGLLAIASRDARRYRPDLGVDLLSHLGDVASLVIGPWVMAA